RTEIYPPGMLGGGPLPPAPDGVPPPEAEVAVQAGEKDKDAKNGKGPGDGKEPAAEPAETGPAAGGRVTGPTGLSQLNVINQIRVTGEQQVMLRVQVAEINRTAARSIGVDWSVATKQGVVVFQNTTGNIAAGTSGTTSISGGTTSAGSGMGSLANIN